MAGIQTVSNIRCNSGMPFQSLTFQIQIQGSFEFLTLNGKESFSLDLGLNMNTSGNELGFLDQIVSPVNQISSNNQPVSGKPPVLAKKFEIWPKFQVDAFNQVPPLQGLIAAPSQDQLNVLEDSVFQKFAKISKFFWKFENTWKESKMALAYVFSCIFYLQSLFWSLCYTYKLQEGFNPKW